MRKRGNRWYIRVNGVRKSSGTDSRAEAALAETRAASDRYVEITDRHHVQLSEKLEQAEVENARLRAALQQRDGDLAQAQKERPTEHPASDDWFRVEVTDHQGQIVAIESEMLAGRDIGAAECETIRKAIRHLSGFIGRDALQTAQKPNEQQSPVGQLQKGEGKC